MSNAPRFAPYYRRFAAVSIDYLAIFFGAAGIQSYLLAPIGLGAPGFRPIFFVFSAVYFAVSWSSPLAATPVQFLFRIRVVDSSGERLNPGWAALRSLLLIGGIVGAMTLFDVPENPKHLFLAVPVIAVLLAGIFTPNRQAAHDYIARSYVVTKDAVRTAEGRRIFHEYVTCNDPGLTRRRWPTPLDIASAVVVVGVPVFGLYQMALTQFDRELRHRISYAYQETQELRTALQEFYLYEDRWASNAEDLGMPVRVDYPDGGYYELEKNGVIRIRFTVIPKLTRIQLTVVPTWNDAELDWNCRTEGEISQGVLPAFCRDN